MLSNIERGTRNPTIGVASRIANGLGTRLSLLLNEVEPTKPAVLLRRGDEVFRDEETGFERHILTPVAAGRLVEIVYHLLPPGVSTGLLPAYPPGTEKYVIGDDGCVTVSVGGDDHAVTEGEVLFVRADREHSFTNARSDRACGYHLVISHRQSRLE